MSNRTINLDDTLYDYLLTHSLREHPEQAALREATRTHPRAGMQISPEQGQFMALLVNCSAPVVHRDRRVHRLQRAERGAGAAGGRQNSRLRHQRRIHPRRQAVSGNAPASRTRSNW